MIAGQNARVFLVLKTKKSKLGEIEGARGSDVGISGGPANDKMANNKQREGRIYTRLGGIGYQEGMQLACMKLYEVLSQERGLCITN